MKLFTSVVKILYSRDYLQREISCTLYGVNNIIIPTHQLFSTLYIYIYIYIYINTGCPRRNVPDFGRVFLMLKYTDITQNTYVQSGTVTEIMARE